MEVALTDRQFRIILAKRVQRFRQRSDKSPSQMAFLLGVAPLTYQKYESRSALPHRALQKFCLVTNATYEQLFTHELSREDHEALNRAGVPVKKAG